MDLICDFICDLICMVMILRLAFANTIITLVGLLGSGPSHYRHNTQYGSERYRLISSFVYPDRNFKQEPQLRSFL